MEHHRDVPSAGEMREQLGVATPGETGQRQRRLVDRSGRDGVEPTGHRISDSLLDRLVGHPARLGRQHARSEPLALCRGV